ncbi:FtsK/SpoIIIE family DNA translocase [Alteriqipengyuania lutimaris]|uniref:DNA translocase FtsK n=1 Tax=Alteriqipengyuania lutimaris TaxID=1538146 RepID=A0A395LJ08_9SPHN|nr:DNA translocase FtsK 4TM domain-containing protein [Alteriqipengyuania lutimaris]MBB3034141.1 S-DNA-T family DNA segregation ATPase FtsK/SpoIIIE [Alteriqipengyuania lutimaris]RDS76928.1 DNA translocase FtsK [Alteriqipengyuania lutimaris]
MASRALVTTEQVDWRAAFRESLKRALQMAGALMLFAGLVFLALALASYTQTDPSPSTAAAPDGPVGNWMGIAGAWAAERALFAFGWTSVLVLPLLYIGARSLWRAANEEDRAAAHTRWWRPLGLLLLAMALLASVVALGLSDVAMALPAGAGGLVGLLGAGATEAVATRIAGGASGWVILFVALGMLAAGAMLVARVFAIDWRGLLTLPSMPRGLARERAAPAPAKPKVRKAKRAEPAMRDVTEPPAAEPAPERRAPRIVDPKTAARKADAHAITRQKDMFADFELPGLDLLSDRGEGNIVPLDRQALERNARLLESVLDDFNVKGEVTAVRTGPVVTMYELEPAPGTKAARVIGLSEDIARNMSAISARVSTIPGKTVMGIELPNAERQMVGFKELAACSDFVDAPGDLPIILGKDIAGEPIIVDLAAMPHLLVAGTTGSGKSVGLNTIILSLLYRFTPAECRLIMVDPKVLELKSYEDIPHLLSPVVTEPEKTIRALKWTIEEMEQRYRKMSEVGARNLTGFNDRVRAAKAKGEPLGRRIQTGYDPETGEEIVEEKELDYEELPLIVVIVDELADLMAVVGKDIEILIRRLTQKSRAAGIHLIMATQRPSVDVITGVIKANLPTRISFKVTSRIDSRTILGEQGAETLLGKGDMLFKPNIGNLTRVHGPFVSDEEVEAVAEHWRKQGEPAYVDAVTEEPESGGGFAFEDELTASDNPDERKYRQACQVVFENQKASGSWLQRQMGVGYNTAAKWIERMESEGLVGPANHVGRRDVYRDKEGNPL